MIEPTPEQKESFCHHLAEKYAKPIDEIRLLLEKPNITHMGSLAGVLVPIDVGHYMTEYFPWLLLVDADDAKGQK